MRSVRVLLMAAAGMALAAGADARTGGGRHPHAAKSAGYDALGGGKGHKGDSLGAYLDPALATGDPTGLGGKPSRKAGSDLASAGGKLPATALPSLGDEGSHRHGGGSHAGGGGPRHGRHKSR